MDIINLHEGATENALDSACHGPIRPPFGRAGQSGRAAENSPRQQTELIQWSARPASTQPFWRPIHAFWCLPFAAFLSSAMCSAFSCPVPHHPPAGCRAGQHPAALLRRLLNPPARRGQGRTKPPAHRARHRGFQPEPHAHADAGQRGRHQPPAAGRTWCWVPPGPGRQRCSP